MALSMEWYWLWLEASQVVMLRTWRLMQGGAAAQHEATRMITEKWDAAARVAMDQASGGFRQSPETAARGAVRHYRRKVAANRRRLSA